MTLREQVARAMLGAMHGDECGFADALMASPERELLNLADAIIPLIAAHERELCAALVERMAEGRKGQELAVINRKGPKSEARDYQTMAIAHSQAAAAIRARGGEGGAG